MNINLNPNKQPISEGAHVLNGSLHRDAAERAEAVEKREKHETLWDKAEI